MKRHHTRKHKTRKQILRKYRKHRFSRKGKRYTMNRGGQNRCFAPSLSIGLHTEQTPVCPGVTMKQRGGDFACGEGATRFGTSPDGAKIVCRHNESGEMFAPDDSKDGM
jgi:hypothetical protein